MSTKHVRPDMERVAHSPTDLEAGNEGTVTVQAQKNSVESRVFRGGPGYPELGSELR